MKVSAKILDGKLVSKIQRRSLHNEVKDLVILSGVIPRLALICVGDNVASNVYIKNKVRACDEVGLQSEVYRFDCDCSKQELTEKIEELNVDNSVHGILVQLPLPNHLDPSIIVEKIDPLKDVDGFHPLNAGGVLSGKKNFFPPCTPLGIISLLDHYKICLAGKHAVVIGRSIIVGKPMAMMLLSRNATVTSCHSQTSDLSSHCSRADLLVVATGQKQIVTADMVKPGSVVVDVGIHKELDGRLVGDVDFPNVGNVASHITPVPGGVGPMTVAGLVANTIFAYRRVINSRGLPG